MTSLIHTKCFNHGTREAVARCPECRRHYCRECITEHEHRLLCASCIDSLARAQERKGKRLPFLGLFQLSGALVILWIAFFIMGELLLLIPSTYHDSEETLLGQIQERKARDDAGDDSGDESGNALSPGGPGL